MLKDTIIIGHEHRARADLFLAAKKAASALRTLGVGPDSPLALLMRNDFAFFEASRAASGLGAYVIPLNWHNKADEIAYVISDSRPNTIVGHADILLGIQEAIPPTLNVLLVPTEGHSPATCPAMAEAQRVFPKAKVWPDWIATYEPDTAEPLMPLGAILYTSGTTGKPKAVRKPTMTPEQLAQFTHFQFHCFGIGPQARALVLGPLYHAMPDAAGRVSVNSAELAVLQPKFDAEDVLRIIHEHRITHIALVPTAFVRLLKLPPEIRAKYDVSSLQKVTHTGGPCPVEVKRQMIDWWGPVICEVYGGTEMGITFYSDSHDWLKYPGTVGRPLEGTRYAIYSDDARVLATGEVGEIYARNPAYGDFTYVGRDEQRREVERDGLITIGDMGYVNDEGYLFLCDRKRDMVISGGVNIYPAEVEAVLLTHPSVHDCAVYGIPDDEMGERLIAAIQLREGQARDAVSLRGYMKEKLTNYKVPSVIEFHDSLPREDSGKIFKRKLRDPHWQGRSRAI